MRVSTAIGGVALTIFTVLIVISFSSMYESTYGSIGSFEIKAKSVKFTNQSMSLFSEISGSNTGHFNELVSLLNSSFMIAPGSNNSTNISLPIDISSLISEGWPSKNVSLSDSMLIFASSLFLKASRNVNISMDLGAPFEGFAISSFKTSSNVGANNISLNFTDFFSQKLNIKSLSIFENNTSIGNVSLPVLSYGKNYNVSGTVNILSNAPQVNLTFKAGPIKWTLNNITVRP